jgi:hypothetical protein
MSAKVSIKHLWAAGRHLGQAWRTMFSSVSEVVISRPRNVVFDYISHLDNDPVWCPGVKQMTPLNSDPPRVGKTYEMMAGPIPQLPLDVVGGRQE